MNDVLRAAALRNFAPGQTPVAAERAPAHRLSRSALVRVIDGCTLADAEGTAYQDFLSGYGTQALGHRNRSLWAALRELLASDSPSFSRRESAPTPAAWLVCWRAHRLQQRELCFQRHRSRRSGAEAGASGNGEAARPRV